ncbi:MAG: response regulator transcription factor [Polyangiales bacterium]
MARVLIVDDEENKRSTLAAALAVEGFEAIGVASADAAVRANDSQAEVAIVDLMLHGTNGFELARQLRSRAPGLRVILTSDYHFSPLQLEKVDCGAIAFVPRPFAFTELARFLRSKLA